MGGTCQNQPNNSACPPGRYCDPSIGCAECLEDIHCDDGNECTHDACSDGACTYTSLSGATCSLGSRSGYCDGTGNCVECLNDDHCDTIPCPECQRATCQPDGTCGCTPVTDGTRCNDDGNDCTLDECRGGVCTHPPKSRGSRCYSPFTGPGYCDGMGRCLECLENANCDDPLRSMCCDGRCLSACP